MFDAHGGNVRSKVAMMIFHILVRLLGKSDVFVFTMKFTNVAVFAVDPRWPLPLDSLEFGSSASRGQKSDHRPRFLFA